MKKLISGLVMMLAIVFTVSAQDSTKHKVHKQHKTHKGHKQHKAQYGNVQLTDAQKSELKMLKEGYKQQHEAIRNNTGLSEAQKKEQRMELMKKRKADMDRILTADQKKQMSEAKMHGRKGEGKKSGRKVGKKGESPMKDLGLTEAQSAKVKSINTRYREKMMELKKNKAAEKTAQKEAFSRLRKQHQEEIRQVLTAEQIQKLNNKQKTTR